jgi:hypothetical protein
MSMPLKTAAILSVVLFSFLSIFLFVHHEVHNLQKEAAGQDTSAHKLRKRTRSITDKAKIFLHLTNQPPDEDVPLPSDPDPLEEDGKPKESVVDTDDRSEEKEEAKKHYRPHIGEPIDTSSEGTAGDADANSRATKTKDHTSEKEYAASGNKESETKGINPGKQQQQQQEEEAEEEKEVPVPIENPNTERKGALTCNGKQIDSEVIYWKVVPGDKTYESPITPHHGQHHDRYLTFEYDQGGWNNVRMGLECFIVLAHAMGRTLVVPPQQHLYLLGKTHKDEGDEKVRVKKSWSSVVVSTCDRTVEYHTVSQRN